MSDFTSHMLASLFGTIIGVLTGYWLWELPKCKELFQYKKAYHQQADQIVEMHTDITALRRDLQLMRDRYGDDVFCG